MNPQSDPNARLRVLLDINHPSQAHVIRAVYEALRQRGHLMEVVARDKDVTHSLLRSFEVPFRSISRPRRGRLGAAIELVDREIRFYSIVRRFRPHVLLGTSVHAARASRLFGGRSVILNEDDARAVPLFCRLAYPGAHRIVTPDCLRHENWGTRHRTYPGTQKLMYLHPHRFVPDLRVAGQLGLPDSFALVRLSSLEAHHDAGRRGLGCGAVVRLASELRGQAEIFVSTERPMAPPEGTRALHIPPEKIHHVMASAAFVVSDSQSMTAEAALLGTPPIRVNDFVGRISYLKELEQAGLAFGFMPEREDEAMAVARGFSTPGSLRDAFKAAHVRYFANMPDPLPWLVALVEELTPDA